MLGGGEEKYDLVCSLGGNCAAAHNLQYKNLRNKALPFDWTYFVSDEAVYKLADGFKDNFKNYALRENFEELSINPNHPDKIQYKDNYAQIIWANQFTYNEDKEIGYLRVKEIIDRRLKRLIRLVNKSKNILFIFSTSYSIKPDCFMHLAYTLKKLYPLKNIKIRVLSFASDKDYIYENQKVAIYYYQRKMNDADFVQTNIEWDFLNHIKIANMALYNIKQKSLKFLINFVPVKSFRKRIRKKYHV